MLLVLMGCGVDPAPEDLDGLLHWSWVNWELASEEDLEEAAATLRGFEDTDGSITDLQPEELEHLGLENKDVESARGWFIVYRFDCDLDTLQELLAEPDQLSLYPDAYETYTREYSSDPEAFVSGASETMEWDSRWSSKYLNNTYEAETKAGLRRVGDVMLGRAWFPEPATATDDDYGWEQDYQNEIFAMDGDRVVHFYGMWREILAAGLTQDDDGLVNLTQNGMRDWDDQTAELCGER